MAPVTDPELLERIDRHLARNETLIDRIGEEFRLNRETYSDLRAFTREIMRRNEMVMGQMVDKLSDLGDQTRANTQAVLRALDRLN